MGWDETKKSDLAPVTPLRRFSGTLARVDSDHHWGSVEAVSKA